MEKNESKVVIPDTSNEIAIPWKDLFQSMADSNKKLGRIDQRLKDILDNDLFTSISRHDPIWHPENYDLSLDRLDILRGKISCLHDNLWEIVRILQNTDE
jgi:hypothetical protein